MAINPMELLKLRERLQIFAGQHPRVPAFLQDVGTNGVREGSVIELRVTTPEGRSYVTNIKVTAEDMETVEILKHIKG